MNNKGWSDLRRLLFLLISVVLLCGCQKNDSVKCATIFSTEAQDSTLSERPLPAGLVLRVDDLCDPTIFDQLAAGYQNVFPQPLGAELIQGDEREEVPADDFRLNRIINILAYSWREHKTVFLQGVISEAEAELWFRQQNPELVIYFSGESEMEHYDYGTVDRILVCGAEILIYYHDNTNGVMIEDHWPFASYLWDMKESGLLSRDDYENVLQHARDDPWLDLITYCDFDKPA